MPRKRLSDLLEEEAKKDINHKNTNQTESVIDVQATSVQDAVDEENTQEESSSAKTKAKPNNPTKADLEAQVKELEQSLEKASKIEDHLQQKLDNLQVSLSEKDELLTQLKSQLEPLQELGNLETTIKELKKDLLVASQHGEDLQHSIESLQSNLSDKDTLITNLKKELNEAKQDAVKLAQSNSEMTEEINQLKQSKQLKQIPPKTPNPQSSSIRPARDYRKSYRNLDKLPVKPSTEPNQSSSQMWLLD
ncbi:MAG: hypothetical protein AAF378_01625 [Cyanobacteria bacterium P01_A01_bin.84]